MVVSVVFGHKFESKEYHYLTDYANYKLGDDVLVPVGEYGHIEVATIVAMWNVSVNSKHSSFPFNAMKHVIAYANRDFLLEQMNAELESVEKKYEKLLSKLN